ncbi:epoxyqueuosine reductase [Sinanaerobacter chloroacetimidivorans]|uniref:Epoxyqueuosine reductase n=1 Tax=Sinanaerobacter chloroacetimidivorans TaxID=2818044 RepID=A0A8J7W2L5_9FIRM|nr:4Fe-4S double cluster binding domain-containing protein [Sinanaerobacter chloroacetimidivorans]MBR0597740.1 epoxyqueuosine reductase [Sinanaerobacter chloroacetimidivorans]
MQQIKDEVRRLAKNNRIEEIRFIDAEDLEPKELFYDRQPKVLLPGAKSLILSSIYIGGYRLPDNGSRIYARTSRLTLSGFYFNIVEPLKPIQEYLQSKGYEAIVYDGFLEDYCVPLKPAAVKAGLGWIGKNTLLLNKKYGSFQALGGIITNADLAECYEIEADHCGSCTACINGCPTKSLEPRKLHRSTCLSHLLEEEEWPEEISSVPQNYFFECDICQEACPWNKKHIQLPLKGSIGSDFTEQEELLELFRYDTLLKMDEKTYQDKILPLLTGFQLPYSLFQRNVRLAYQAGCGSSDSSAIGIHSSI